MMKLIIQMERRTSNIKTKEQLEDLENITKPVIEWIKKHCNPYESVIITCDEIKVISVDSGIPL